MALARAPAATGGGRALVQMTHEGRLDLPPRGEVMKMKDFDEFEKIANGDEFHDEVGKMLASMSIVGAADGRSIDYDTLDASVAATHEVCLEMLRRYHEWANH